ncbi:retrovirus-related pol polyprotein from transposon TNT 1-94 [Tanacetum coccineum]
MGYLPSRTMGFLAYWKRSSQFDCLCVIGHGFTEGDQNVQDLRAELDNLLVQNQEGYVSSTNRVSTVSPSVSAAGQMFVVAYDDKVVVKRLVAQGYTQEEGIDYDKVLLYVARIEAIRLFLSYASFMRFIVYQMDVKSAFLYGTIKEEVYVCQPPCFEDPQFFDKVYKMSSIGELTFFLGLQVKQKDDGIFISQDKYVADILKKFDFAIVKTSSTPIETNKALLKDEEAKDVDVHLYRSMIGSLMYLTASRSRILFVVCVCAWFQVTLKSNIFMQ